MDYEVESVRKYYQEPAVRARIDEYIGPENSCVYLTRADVRNQIRKPVSELECFFEAGWDISRSLWDRKSLIAHIDLEYVNFDSEAAAYLDTGRSFALQEPVVLAASEILKEYGIEFLHLRSGRGHHLVWKLERSSDVFLRLASWGRLTEELRARYNRPHPPADEPVAFDLASAYCGLGLLCEYLGHLIRERAAGGTTVPIELTAVHCGPGERGRENVTIDLSEYGDPLHLRHIRVPFTVYRKNLENGAAVALRAAGRSGELTFTIPFSDLANAAAEAVAHDPEKVVDLAKRTSVEIPLSANGTERLLAAYEKSELKGYHDWFYSQEQQPVHAWPETYDRVPLEVLPPCVTYILCHPNDLLLKPAGMLQVVRTFLALGWHPRHIAGLIRSKFERDFGWGQMWYKYDAGSRADFYTRLFTGLVCTGSDSLIDFNCRSTQEKGFCFDAADNCSLERFKLSLLEWRSHERLANRPFNGLFLPDENYRSP